MFSGLLSIAAFIPAHWHIWRTTPCLCRSLQCTALQSEPSPRDQSPPWERKRELKEEKDKEKGIRRAREYFKQQEQMQTHISWHVTLILSEASSSFKRIVHLKKWKFCHRLLVSNTYDFFTSMENKSTPSQRPVKLQQGQKSPIKVVYMTHTLYSMASEAIK